MKKSYIILIVSLFLILFIPIAYYFCYALPKHNSELQQIERDKLYYEQERDREAYERELDAKYEKERKYNDCIDIANSARTEQFKSYCDLGYKSCTEDIDYWNGLIPNSHSYSECEKYKYKDGVCFMLNKYKSEFDDWYSNQISTCDRFL